MDNLTKIATCSYCGTRTVLYLAGKERHELACRNCGALLHDMKPLKANAKPAKRSKSFPPPHRASDLLKPKKAKKSAKKNKRKKRETDLFDIVEDIFDDLGDIFD